MAALQTPDYRQITEGQQKAWSTGDFNQIARQIMDAGGTCGFTHLPDRPDDERQRNRRRVSQLTDKYENAAFLVPMDAQNDDNIREVMATTADKFGKIDFLLHSIAFADYSDGMKPFHETTKQQFLQAVDISCFSLVKLANALKDRFAEDASVVTISISTTRMASESYGYMAPIKAALDSSLAFLAKSFSRFSRVRFNAVGPSLLKTSASAGIPGYVDSYIYAEKVIPRQQALTTQEAADVAVFLLSPRSSGIQAQNVVVDAGMSINYFDRDVVSATVGGKEG
jgi:enoyl-[acyl-carrier protein] reductase I